MFRIIILPFILLSYINGFTQNSEYDLKLLAYETNYFYANDSITQNNALLQKVNYMLQNDSINENTLQNLKRINFAIVEVNEQSKLFWNAALLSYLNQEYYLSMYYLKQYQENSNNDGSNELLLFKTILYSKFDTIISNESIKELILLNDSTFTCLYCLSDINNFELKHAKFFGISTLFIPGLYSFNIGEVGTGITSLGLNTGVFFTLRALYHQNLYINMITWGSNLFTKFYLGNRSLLNNQMVLRRIKIKEKRANKCTLQLKDLLTKYPLQFIF